MDSDMDWLNLELYQPLYDLCMIPFDICHFINSFKMHNTGMSSA